MGFQDDGAMLKHGRAMPGLRTPDELSSLVKDVTCCAGENTYV